MATRPSAEEAALLAKLSQFGWVGPRPPVLTGYTQHTTYTVGTPIAHNSPVGKLEIGKGGLLFAAQQLPTGLVIDAATGVLSGTPTQESPGQTCKYLPQVRNKPNKTDKAEKPEKTQHHQERGVGYSNKRS